MKIKKHDIIELEIETMAFGGQGIARVDGYVVFVKGGIPGDRLKARVFKKKRDFTINAMAYSLSSEKIIDCAGGMKDLADKKIRMVSDTVFENDPVRLIRAYRIGASLHFEIEANTLSFIKKNANSLD